MPIIDFHCHLPPADVARDTRFKTLAHAWLGGDHYKWRAMRANGVPEEDITGHEPDYRTFLAWARTVPRLVGNPLYHWTHLELQRYFGIQRAALRASAPMIWEACNAQLATPEFGARALLTRMKVRAVCTTDDPADSLEHHIAYAAARQPGEPVMAPSFRPDKAMAVEDPAAWNAYLGRLEAAADLAIGSLPRPGDRPGPAPRRLPRAGLPGLGPRPGGAGRQLRHAEALDRHLRRPAQGQRARPGRTRKPSGPRCCWKWAA